MIVRDVIRRAMLLNGDLSEGLQPNTDEFSDMLDVLNMMKRAMFGAVIGPVLNTVSLAGLQYAQAENGGLYQIPALSFLLNAPANPTGGARFGVVDATLNFGNYGCTINPNGQQIQGSSSNVGLVTNGDNRIWWFRPDTGNWVLEADYVSANDTIEFPSSLAAYMPYMLAVAAGGEFGADIRQDVVSFASEGRTAFARLLGRSGANQINPPLGNAAAQH